MTSPFPAGQLITFMVSLILVSPPVTPPYSWRTSFPFLIICWCLLRKHKLTLTFVQNITHKICLRSTQDAFQSQLAFLICVTHAISQSCQGIIKIRGENVILFMLRYSGCSREKTLTFSGEEERSAWLNLKKTINSRHMLWSLYPLASGREWHLEHSLFKALAPGHSWSTRSLWRHLISAFCMIAYGYRRGNVPSSPFRVNWQLERRLPCKVMVNSEVRDFTLLIFLIFSMLRIGPGT